MMTLVQDNLIRVSVKIFGVGFLVGLALALFVLCNVVHAAETGGGTGQFEPIVQIGEARLRSQEIVPLCHGDDKGDALCYDFKANRFVTACQITMETAMRAMEPYVRPELHAEGFYDGCNYCSSGGCTALACPLGGNEVARLEWELKRAKQKEEAGKQRIAALAQWELGKACWRKP